MRKKRASKILMGLVLLSMVMFSSLKYIEIRIKSDPVKPNNISTNTVLDAESVIIPTVAESPAANNETVISETEKALTPEIAQPVVATPEPVSADVLKALAWLGTQSLEEYKLTYPAKDNAYYYFSRILKMDPGNQEAIRGILEISDRYAVQAEQALAKNENEKMLTYIEYGLRINPQNESLQALKSLAGSQDTSLLGTIKSLFSN